MSMSFFYERRSCIITWKTIWVYNKLFYVNARNKGVLIKYFRANSISQIIDNCWNRKLKIIIFQNKFYLMTINDWRNIYQFSCIFTESKMKKIQIIFHSDRYYCKIKRVSSSINSSSILRATFLCERLFNKSIRVVLKLIVWEVSSVRYLINLIITLDQKLVNSFLSYTSDTYMWSWKWWKC